MWECQKSGEIYKARIESVLPGMNSAFVSLGDGRNGFLYLKDARGIDIYENEEILVQVTKTARKNKGARVTTRLSLPGRFLVFIPDGREIGVSKRIENPEERERLRSIVRSLNVHDCGVIVRTASEGVDRDAIESDLLNLKELWCQIEKDACVQPAPSLLYRDMGLTGRVLRDELNANVTEIITDNAEEVAHISEYLGHYPVPGIKPAVSLHRSIVPLFEYYDIEKQIEALLNPKIWLPSGGYLVIDQAEALTAIDVNTGKFTGGKNLAETVLATNLEAADEIARQLRLRAIGGIIVVDFIDMEPAEDRKTLMERLNRVFLNDHCKVHVYGLSQLGLVEMTRKRARADMRSVLTRPCPACEGSSLILKEDEIALSLKRFLRKIFASGKGKAVLVDAHPDIAHYAAQLYLKNWEEEFDRRIVIRGDKEMAWKRFRLDVQGTIECIDLKAASGRSRGEQNIVYRTTDP